MYNADLQEIDVDYEALETQAMNELQVQSDLLLLAFAEANNIVRKYQAQKVYLDFNPIQALGIDPRDYEYNNGWQSSMNC